MATEDQDVVALLNVKSGISSLDRKNPFSS